ncbi:glycosyltransferase family 2 protein [Chitinophaga sp. NPDC101104]|uniref:glycosyltransferase family 2 protein n=1 Tax=Chitinophaga sp. NPDC101104 TaxID=3390561 RepID=UPI003CFE9261
MLEGGNRTQRQKSGNPIVSIITVTRNAADCLETAIQSVLSQSFPDVEHIILDGASTDGTIEILKKYNDQIAYWKSEADGGVYDAMNKAVQYAQGKWVLFLGADDELFDGFSEMAERHLKRPDHIYYGCSLWKNLVFGCQYSGYMLAKENITHQSIFYPRSIFDTYKFSLKYKVRADYVMNMQLWADKRYRFEYVRLLISRYAAGGFSGQVIDEAFRKDRVRLVGKYLGFFVKLRYILKRYKYKRINFVEY